jgi:two-component system sensor histidine kinase KdpD
VGLGLAICRSIVQAHGGSIHADNDDGACVTFTLPLGEPPAIELEDEHE